MSGCLERKIADTGKCEEQEEQNEGGNRNRDFNWDWSRRVVKNGQKRIRIQSIKNIEKHIGNHIVLYLPKIANNTYKHSLYMPVC